MATPPGRDTAKNPAKSPAKPKRRVVAAKPPAPPVRAAAAKKVAAPRAAARHNATARPRARRAPLNTVSTTASPAKSHAVTTAPARRGWWKTLAGGVGALAAGAALLSLRGSTRRKAHQADGADSSESFAAGIADEGTIPDTPAQE
ncbi:hypothetical protein EAH79_04315 [Sphingomonas koreensis]|nr:hypothetical protein EAH79_04315 [Sphingomonas koreensis]